jgi:2-polyprenyl-3-methyl-5-hydroxy-6-metoxy-1,4-benzoquinol methylase
MAIQPNLYQEVAFLYDFDTRDIVKVDIPFYLEYAAKYRGNILELACGTGRVSISLAQNGYKVYGLDLSDSMLERFKKKLADQPKNVQDNIGFEKYDMSSFQLNQEFSLIIVPFRGSQALTTEEMQRNCLKCIDKHLENKGVFIINTFRPYTKMDESWVYPEIVQWEALDEKTGNKIVKNIGARKSML